MQNKLLVVLNSSQTETASDREAVRTKPSEAAPYGSVWVC